MFKFNRQPKKDERVDCPSCGGKRVVWIEQEGRSGLVKKMCTVCNGTGSIRA